jgi:hypothetical protein
MKHQDGNNFYALLIGIDCYLPNRLPDGTSYRNLTGCVQDILRVEEFLLVSYKLSGDHIIKLTSSNNDKGEPSETHEQWPTRRNIVLAFQKLTSIAKPGDQIYIHYSGHGGRVRTPVRFRALKGSSGVDEVLIPMDIGDSEEHYLRDFEIAFLLREMVEKQLLVTMVMDCCHSVSATSRWLLEPKGYVLLTACRANEAAYEFPFDGQEKNGALSYWLVDSLKNLSPELTYNVLYQRILAKVHSQFAGQTPQLHGEGDRVVFGREQVKTQPAVGVMSVDMDNQQVELLTGQAQGINKGARFIVHSLEATDLTQPDGRLALVEITELGATKSRAKIVYSFRPVLIEQGARAELSDVGRTHLRRIVRITRESKLSSHSDEVALQAIERALSENGNGFLQLASESEAADYEVIVTDSDEYSILDSIGAEVPNLWPVLGIFDYQAPTRVVERLVHLTKYQNIRELENWDPFAPLSRRIAVELSGGQAEYLVGESSEPKPFLDADNTQTVKDCEHVFLRIRNNYSDILNITVLDLQPDWGVTQIYPPGSGYFEPLDPGRELTLSLHASPLTDMGEGTHIIKVFATVGVSNFRWLELPPLDRSFGAEQNFRETPDDSLENILSTAALEECGTREMRVAPGASGEWITYQVELKVQRSLPERERELYQNFE